MVIGVGVDLVQAERVKEMIARHGDRFLRRLFLPGEIAYCQRGRTTHLSFAAHVAAKESAAKAIGTGWRQGVHWKCFEVIHEPSGKPTLAIHGQAREIARRLGIKRASLSLSHDGGMAIACTIMES